MEARTDWRKLQQEIVEAAPSLGIDKIGFTSAEPFHELKDILLRHREKGFESGFEEPDIEKRVHPELSFDAPRSIISIAVAYPSKLPNPPRSEPGAYRGMISRSSWGSDYHDVLRDRLAKLEAFIAQRVPEARLQSMVDTGALVDRAVAERAGIGWSGKNCAVITPEWGSWVYLGEMITNIPFDIRYIYYGPMRRLHDLHRCLSDRGASRPRAAEFKPLHLLHHTDQRVCG